jgi:methylmalonyl-CoA mutase
VEALAAVLGGTQSLHTNALDEAIALPTDFSARIARNTQLYLQEETDITKAIDPWGGSYYVESLTREIADKAWELIEEVEELGGMAKAIETGLPKMRIEEAAARKQARIDSGKDTIVGVNRYQVESDREIEILDVDNQAVRVGQVERLRKLREERNDEETNAALAELEKVAETGEGNLLEVAVKCARARASLGEISDAMEKSFGMKPIPLRSGGSIPIVALFEEVLGLKTVLMGFGLDTDAIHSPNENYGLFNFYKGIETIPYFYDEFAKLNK